MTETEFKIPRLVKDLPVIDVLPDSQCKTCYGRGRMVIHTRLGKNDVWCGCVTNKAYKLAREKGILGNFNIKIKVTQVLQGDGSNTIRAKL